MTHEISQDAIDAAVDAFAKNTPNNTLTERMIAALKAAAPFMLAKNKAKIQEGVSRDVHFYWVEDNYCDNLRDLLEYKDEFELFEGSKPTEVQDVFAFWAEDLNDERHYFEFVTEREALAKIEELKTLWAKVEEI